MNRSRRAFPTLLHQHQDRLVRIAERIVGHHEDARDVVQEVFARAEGHIDDLASAAVLPWLVRCTTRRALDFKRASARKPRLLLGDHAHEIAAPEMGLEPLDREVLGRQLSQSFALLSPRQRQVLKMRLLDNQSFGALSSALGISEGAAKTHFCRGIRVLRQALDERTRDVRSR